MLAGFGAETRANSPDGVDSRMQEVTPGLFCAGESAGGLALRGLLRCTVFGHVAAREAALEETWYSYCTNSGGLDMNARRFLMAAAVAVLAPVAALAHHSHASLDREDVRVLSGVVTRYGWTMPHVFLKVEAPNREGEIVEYTIELQNPPSMTRNGWDSDTFKSGDRITWEGPHDKNKSRYYTGMTWAERGDGIRVGTASSVAAEEVQEVQSSTDFTGLWVRDLRGGPMHFYPPEGWPYTALGRELVANFDETSNPQTECMNPGPPKYMLLPYPVEISRPDDRTVVMRGELREHARVVHLDRNVPPAEPSVMGHSVGWFEGDQLVVETTNFVADRWGSHTGVDSSAEKRLLEGFSLANEGMALEVSITITDPVFLAEPVTFDHYFRKLADRELVEAPCTLESSTLYLEAGYPEA